MKKIKLAVLAVCLLTGVIGAYGTSKKSIYYYWAAPNAPVDGALVYVSSSSPAIQCAGGTSNAYICRFSSEEVLNSSDMAWVSEVIVMSSYGN